MRPERGKGGATAAREDGKERERDSEPAGGRVAVELAHSRGSHVRWVLIGGALGIACVLGLGTLGKVLGVVLLLLAAWAAFKLVLTYLNPPGTIVVDGDEVSLPRGLCRGAPAKVGKGEVTAAYFLRRSVPWTKAAPVLIIEVGKDAFAYPRDWFASEADQRRVLEALAPA
jgi:hypothetical protein